ncbi:MAG TPA: choice-of-anchor tandem repeat GloVer-containing protein [Terriglobales bacterium]|nr:choice-of-anchor tandem repeat GloVer-containing protein [Terriglobales bacterium]
MLKRILVVNRISLVASLIFALVSVGFARDREKTLYIFPGGSQGDNPEAGVVSDSDGNLYGTTYYGGAYGWGTVFELRHSQRGWTHEVLYSFLGSYDGFSPTGNLLLDKVGNLYGTTQYGGTGTTCSGNPCNGTVFELVRSGGWKHSVLHSFCSASACSDGAGPSGLTFDKAGNLFGTTVAGGTGCQPDGCGAVYELTPSNEGWTETVLYHFDQNNGGGFFPAAGVALDDVGNIYGTTYVGGANNFGDVFELKHTNRHWEELVLYSFTTGEGGANGGLTLDGADVIFGTTQYGDGVGGVFELRRSRGKWNENILYSGNGPNSQLILDKTGALYGTSLFGGANGYGYVFRLQHKKLWQFDVLHSFVGGSDGANPAAGLILGADANLYGTTSSYDSQYGGTVFQITP